MSPLVECLTKLSSVLMLRGNKFNYIQYFIQFNKVTFNDSLTYDFPIVHKNFIKICNTHYVVCYTQVSSIPVLINFKNKMEYFVFFFFFVRLFTVYDLI